MYGNLNIEIKSYRLHSKNQSRKKSNYCQLFNNIILSKINLVSYKKNVFLLQQRTVRNVGEVTNLFYAVFHVNWSFLLVSL